MDTAPCSEHTAPKIKVQPFRLRMPHEFCAPRPSQHVAPWIEVQRFGLRILAFHHEFYAPRPCSHHTVTRRGRPYLFGDKSIERALVQVVTLRVHKRRISCLGNSFGVFRKILNNFFPCPFGLAYGERDSASSERARRLGGARGCSGANHIIFIALS